MSEATVILVDREHLVGLVRTHALVVTFVAQVDVGADQAHVRAPVPLAHDLGLIAAITARDETRVKIFIVRIQ